MHHNIRRHPNILRILPKQPISPTAKNLKILKTAHKNNLIPKTQKILQQSIKIKIKTKTKTKTKEIENSGIHK